MIARFCRKKIGRRRQSKIHEHWEDRISGACNQVGLGYFIIRIKLWGPRVLGNLSKSGSTVEKNDFMSSRTVRQKNHNIYFKLCT